MIRLARRLPTWIVVAIAILSFDSGLAQQSGQPNRHYQEWRYFHDQRAYPRDRIPTGAYQAARRDYERKWGYAGGESAPTINVSGWSLIGPSQTYLEFAGDNPPFIFSGRLTTIAVHPTNASIIYIGAAEGGVWKTVNGGTTWTPLTDRQCSLAMGSIAIDPVNPNIVYAGTGEQNYYPISYYGCGILRSSDGGATWTQFSTSAFQTNFGGATIAKVVIDATTAGSTSTTKLFAATSFGLYRSTNSGNTWAQVLAGVASDVVIDPSNPMLVYVALGNIGSGASNGVYKSTDGGGTFSKLGGGLPTANIGGVTLDIARSTPATVYAAILNSSTSTILGIFKTTNGGTNWTQLTATGASCSSGSDGATCWFPPYIAVDPINANTVYVGARELFKSIDGGASFFEIDLTNTQCCGAVELFVDQHAFAFQPGNPNTIFAGGDDGIFESSDGGSTWTSLNTNLSTIQFYPGFSLHPTNALIALGGTQDHGTIQYSGSTIWPELNFVGGGCDGGFTAIDFTTPTTLYSECNWNDPSNNGPRRSDNGGNFALVANGINLNDAARFAPPLVMSSTNSQQLFFGTVRLYQSTNGAESWAAISPDLTKGNCGVIFNCGISAIVHTMSSTTTIYVGTSDGNVQQTTNGGGSWNLVTGGLPNRAVTYLAVDPTNAQNAVVVFSGFNSTTPTTPGHVFKTTNGGASWSNISGNLPDIPVNVILLDPSAPATNFFIGTDLGVFHSSTGGNSWCAFNNGLPNVAVLDLVLNPTTGMLVAATHGRGAWKATSGTPPACRSAAATHDFDGDGRSDILWRHTGGNTAMWSMNGAIISASASLGVIPTTWSVAGQRDFNGDTRHDILWRDTSGNLAIWFMNGATVSSSALLGNVPTAWSVAGTGDFNGDGKGDILWRHTNGNVAIWLMNGATVTSTVTVGNVPAAWSIAGTGDFDGDGNTDILWRNSNGNLAVWLMNGGTVSSAVTVGNVPIAWSIVGTGDFNGDGKTDILWRHTSGALAIWMMNGGTVSSMVSVANVATTWSVAETGDFNGDGKSDILWYDASGKVAIWFMNGGVITSNSPVANVATAWSIQGANAD
jgi:hypothetical protein